MADIEPYKQIKTTNIQEHNDMVDKINEIVNVINNSDLENIGPKIDAIESTDTLQWKDIESIKAKDTEQDSTLATHTTEIDGITKSLVSDVVLMNGTTSGNMKVRIECKDAPFIDSDDYNIQKPTSVQLVQGSAPAMVKAQITLSDGTVLVSDDFMFTTESIGQDVYISSFVFKNGNVAGTISADIGLSNGTTLEANNFVVPTDPNVTSSITDLQTRMAAVESADVGELAILKTTVAEHTVAITALDNDVADIMLNKADVDNVNQVIVSKQIDLDAIIRLKGHSEDSTEFVKYGIIGGSPTNPFSVTQETEAFGQIVDKPIGSIAMLDSNGNPKNFRAGGEVWEEVDLNNWPTDWVEGDRIKIETWANVDSSGTFSDNGDHSALIEVRLSSSAIYVPLSVGYSKTRRLEVLSISSLNKGSICRITINNITSGDQTASGYLRTTDSNYNTQKNYFRILRLKK